jgi:hypothetical protein
MIEINYKPWNQIVAEWSHDVVDQPVDVSKLTHDEQADLIIEKLKAPPKPKASLLADYAEILAKVMADEIDKAILVKLKGLK